MSGSDLDDLEADQHALEEAAKDGFDEENEVQAEDTTADDAMVPEWPAGPLIA